MAEKLTRGDVLNKCITVFEAIRRMASRGNAGLLPEKGAEEEYNTVDECIRIMKEWRREMQAGKPYAQPEDEGFDPQADVRKYETTTLEDMMRGNPLMTAETIEAARRVDEARDRMIRKMTQPEPDAPKVTDLREWQRLAAEKPPERLDFDEDS